MDVASPSGAYSLEVGKRLVQQYYADLLMEDEDRSVLWEIVTGIMCSRQCLLPFHMPQSKTKHISECDMRNVALGQNEAFMTEAYAMRILHELLVKTLQFLAHSVNEHLSKEMDK